jgi:hypothetical protein
MLLCATEMSKRAEMDIVGQALSPANRREAPTPAAETEVLA